MSSYILENVQPLVKGCLSANNARMSGFADYIRQRREAIGQPQGEVADAAGITRPYMSQLESGKVKTPGADIRRRLAQALGVTHLDLLVAAGELTSDEVAPKEPSDPVLEDVFAGLIPMARRIEWAKAERIATVRTIFEMYMREDRTGVRQEGARIMGEETETVIEQRDRRVP